MSHDGSGQPLFRVSIAVPSGDLVHAAFAMALAELSSGSQRLTLQFVNSRSSIVAIARNDAVAVAQDFGADYILFLDADMIFPPTTLLRLLLHRKEIVGATYVKRVPPYTVLGTALEDQTDPGSLVEMARIPTGCLLIDMQVFGRLTRPYFHFATDRATGTITGEDYLFCDDARAAGFRIWCDPDLSMELGHVGTQVFRMANPAG